MVAPGFVSGGCWIDREGVKYVDERDCGWNPIRRRAFTKSWELNVWLSS